MDSAWPPGAAEGWNRHSHQREETAIIPLRLARPSNIPRRPIRALGPAVTGALALAIAGCQFGPSALKISHTQYNQALQESAAEQLLLNLVRLRYGEAPVFLEVGSVSAQFVFDQSGDIAGTLNENVGAQRGNPDVLRLGGSLGYTERPTISYAPLSGDDFVQRLLSPISLNTIVLLTHSGWRMDRVFRLIVQEMNGLENARAASGPTPASAPAYAGFADAARLLWSLQEKRLIELGYETVTEEVSDPINIAALTADALVQAAKAGHRFRAVANGNSYVLTRQVRRLVVRFGQDPKGEEGVPALREALRLQAGKQEYRLVPSASVRTIGAAAQTAGESVAIDARSLLGVMFYLSQGVQVPKAHVRGGRVTTTQDVSGPFDWSSVLGRLFKVHSSTLPPRGAAVAVHHRGYWFYILDTDQDSKSTFSLLGQLFTLQAGSAKGTTPVLTLPIGG